MWKFVLTLVSLSFWSDGLRASARLSAVLTLVLWLTACSSSLAPEDRVEVTLVATLSTVAVGDTVHLIGVAFNPTPTQIQPASGCAPGIGFYVRDGSGDEVSLYDGLGFNCARLDSQDIDPGETDSIQFAWVPSSTGTYQVRAALVFAGPRSPSDPVAITVR